MSLLVDRIAEPAVVRDAPFPLLIATDVLDRDAEAMIGQDFPRYRGAGFFPYAQSDCGPAMNALVAELTSPTFSDRIGDLLGIDRLSQYPVLVTICRALNLRHGTIHTDSQSKVASALRVPQSRVGGIARRLPAFPVRRQRHRGARRS